MSNSQSFPWFASYDLCVPHQVPRWEKPLFAFLDASADAWPERTAIIHAQLRITYGQLRQMSEQFAAALGQAGIRPGERIGLMLPNLPQTIIAFWGILKAGCTVVMLNPLYREKEILTKLADARIRNLILQDKLWQHVAPYEKTLGLHNCILTSDADFAEDPEAGADHALPRAEGHAHLHFWRDFCQSGGTFAGNAAPAADSPALLQYTGGTTGPSKGAILTHACIGTNAIQVAAFLNMQAEDDHVVLGILPFFHIYGLCVCLVMSAAIGAAVIPVPEFVPLQLLQTISEHRPTFFPGAPAMYITLLQQKSLAKYDLRSIHICLSGSAPLPREIFRRFQEVTGASILEAYGLTEASPVTHINPYGRKERRENSIGLPISSTEAMIVDQDNGVLPVPNGTPGELIIRGPQVMPGYWEKPDETANAIRNGWLYTGDVAIMDDDGYFYIVDRKKDMVITGGYNVYPREVDEILAEHPKILEAVCVGLPDSVKGEILKAYIVTRPGEKMTRPEVVAYCRSRLASYKVPRQVEFRDALPRSTVGKILRRLLRDEEMARRQLA